MTAICLVVGLPHVSHCAWPVPTSRAPPERRFGAGAGGIFPLGLAGQPVLLTGLLRQPGHEQLGIIPAYVDRPAGRPGPSRDRQGGACRRLHQRTGPTRRTSPRGGRSQTAAGSRSYVPASHRRVIGPHREVARRNHHEFGTAVAIPKDFAGIEAGRVTLCHQASADTGRSADGPLVSPRCAFASVLSDPVNAVRNITDSTRNFMSLFPRKSHRAPKNVNATLENMKVTPKNMNVASNGP